MKRQEEKASYVFEIRIQNKFKSRSGKNYSVLRHSERDKLPRAVVAKEAVVNICPLVEPDVMALDKLVFPNVEELKVLGVVPV